MVPTGNTAKQLSWVDHFSKPSHQLLELTIVPVGVTSCLNSNHAVICATPRCKL